MTVQLHFRLISAPFLPRNPALTASESCRGPRFHLGFRRSAENEGSLREEQNLRPRLLDAATSYYYQLLRFTHTFRLIAESMKGALCDAATYF
jgi:hypothetical protein